MLNLQFQVMWWDTLSRAFETLGDEIKDRSEAMAESVDIIQEGVNKNFSGEKSDTEWRWSSLAPRTSKARDRRRWYYRQSPRNPGLLRRTGRLQESVNKTVRPLMWVLEYTAPYAKYHNIGWRKIPKRKFLELSPDTKHLIDGVFIKYLNKKVWNRNINKKKK